MIENIIIIHKYNYSTSIYINTEGGAIRTEEERVDKLVHQEYISAIYSNDIITSDSKVKRTRNGKGWRRLFKMCFRSE